MLAILMSRSDVRATAFLTSMLDVSAGHSDEYVRCKGYRLSDEQVRYKCRAILTRRSEVSAGHYVE